MKFSYFSNIFCLIIKVVHSNRAIGLISRVITNGFENQGSIPGRVIPKTQKNGT